MGDIKAFADSLVKAREQYERDTVKDIIKRAESLFNRYRSANYVGFDVTLRNKQTMMEDFEKALELLSDCYEELSDD